MKALYVILQLNTRGNLLLINKRQQTRRKMEKMDDNDVIIFSCATLTLACVVNMLSNEKA